MKTSVRHQGTLPFVDGAPPPRRSHAKLVVPPGYAPLPVAARERGLTTRQLKERLRRLERSRGVCALVRFYPGSHPLVYLDALERYRADLVRDGRADQADPKRAGENVLASNEVHLERLGRIEAGIASLHELLGQLVNMMALHGEST